MEPITSDIAAAVSGEVLQTAPVQLVRETTYGEKCCRTTSSVCSLSSLDSAGGSSTNLILESVKLMLELLIGLFEVLVERLKAPAARPPSLPPPSAPPPSPAPPATTPPATTPPTTTPPTTKPPVTTPPPSAISFKEKAQQLLVPDAKGQVSEAHLHFAITSYELSRKSADVAKRFEDGYRAYRSGGSFIDTSIRRSLADLVSSSGITKEESDKIYRTAFRAAQLDTDFERLSGRNGGTNLRTGKAPLAEAIAAAEATLSRIADGSITLPAAV